MKSNFKIMDSDMHLRQPRQKYRKNIWNRSGASARRGF